MARMMVMVCDCCALRAELPLDYCDTPAPWITVSVLTPGGNTMEGESAYYYACGRVCAMQLLQGLSLRTESDVWSAMSVRVSKKKESSECL